MLKFVAKTGLPVYPQQSPSCDDSAPQSVAKRPRLVVPESSSTADFSMIDGVNDIANDLCEPPSQPILKEYPKRVFGSRTRCFNKEWYKERPWLEYSISSDSVFCYCCRAFSNFSTSDQWTKIGFSNWKGALEENKGFKLHGASEPHITASLKWCSYQESVRSGSIITKIAAISRQDILDNRHYIKTVSQVVVLCSVLDIGLRGHREGRLVDSSRHSVELDFNCGNRNRGNFLEEEQLSICLRFVYCGLLYEDFYNFVKADGLDSRSIMAVLKKQLDGMGVDTASHLIAQCYDGASVMSGRLGGLQAIMRESVCPMAIYVHCWAHRLNLVVVSYVYGIDKAARFFENMQTLYKFFSASVPHDYFQATQKDLRENLDEGKALHINELKSISKTRWCCQAEACDAVVATLGSVIKSVEHFADDDNYERRATAQVIVGFIDTDFIVCLVLFQNILRKCSIAANYLQSVDMDTSRAVDLINALRESLAAPELFDEVWQNAKTMTDTHEMAAPLEIRRRRCRQDSNQHTWTKIDYKERLFDKVVKAFVGELNKRFDFSACEILRSMSSLIPSSSHFLEFDTLKPLARHYTLDERLLRNEMDVFTEQYRNMDPGCKSLLDMLHFIEPYRSCYVQLYKAMVIAATIPVTSAENERSFSCLKRTKTYLRSAMNDERLGDLATLSINRERTSISTLRR